MTTDWKRIDFSKKPAGLLTKEQRAYLRLQEKTRTQIKALEAKLEAARIAAAKSCQHPVEAREDYRWEHDNGYGRQSWVTGERCTICRHQRSWKGSSTWWDPSRQNRDD